MMSFSKFMSTFVLAFSLSLSFVPCSEGMAAERDDILSAAKPKASASSAAPAAAEAPVVVADLPACQQPVIVRKKIAPDDHRSQILILEEKKWVNGTRLFYYFIDGAADQQAVVRGAFDKWKSLGIGLSFSEIADPSKAQIKIGFEPGKGSWSYIGRDALEYAGQPSDKTMNFGWDLRTPYGWVTALHEIGHALGFPHEHQSPKSGITWNTPAVYTYFRGPPNYWPDETIRHNILTPLPESEVRGSDWDPLSVMHYAFRAGLISLPEKYSREDLPPARDLSAKDIQWVRAFYPETPISGGTKLEPFQSILIDLDNGKQVEFAIRPPRARPYTIQAFGDINVVMVLFDQEDHSVLSAVDNSQPGSVAKMTTSLAAEKDYRLAVRLNFAPRKGEGSVMLY